MREREPVTQTMSTSAASKALPNLVYQVSRQETRVVVEENGKPVAAIVSTEDLARLTQLDKQRTEEWRVFEEIHGRNRDKDPDDVERDVAEAIAEMREEERRTRKPHSAL
jgi:prevent-host-death family protein